jgi:16S rRNA (adenine1518-N6/adenine1519-N6)-dimethyltransferase
MTDAKGTLRSLGLRARKNLGQNFMTRESDLRFIADALEVRTGETILEIGPGLGALTALLLETDAHVLAVEKDRSLAEILRKKFSGKPLQVLGRDILEFDPAREPVFKTPGIVVGNIPYNITSPILYWLVKHRFFFRRAVLTMQKEVAQRLAGNPGTKIWGALSVSVQAYAEVVFLKKISKGNFYPAPKVDSAVVRLDFLEKPRYPEGFGELFHETVARAFQKRRKTLLNALENPPSLSKERLRSVFRAAGFDPRRRPETLSVAEWASLTTHLSKPADK